MILLYFLGASSRAQKDCPAAFGRALASSDRDEATPIETMKSRMVPYTSSAGPPELIPVTIDVSNDSHLSSSAMYFEGSFITLKSLRYPRSRLVEAKIARQDLYLLIAALTAHQELVSEKPTPRTDQTENFLPIACLYPISSSLLESTSASSTAPASIDAFDSVLIVLLRFIAVAIEKKGSWISGLQVIQNVNPYGTEQRYSLHSCATGLPYP